MRGVASFAISDVGGFEWGGLRLDRKAKGLSLLREMWGKTRLLTRSAARSVSHLLRIGSQLLHVFSREMGDWRIPELTKSVRP